MNREAIISKLTEIQQNVDQLLAQLQASEHDKFATHLYRSRREYRSVCQHAGKFKGEFRPLSFYKGRVHDVMEKQAYYCRENQSVDEALRIMREHGLPYLPVVDSNLRVVGVVRRHY